MFLTLIFFFSLILPNNRAIDIFSVQQIDEMLAGSLSQEDEDAILAELEAITQVLHPHHRLFIIMMMMMMITFFCDLLQGDVLLPDVPSDQLPDTPEADEEKAGL